MFASITSSAPLLLISCLSATVLGPGLLVFFLLRARKSTTSSHHPLPFLLLLLALLSVIAWGFVPAAARHLQGPFFSLVYRA